MISGQTSFLQALGWAVLNSLWQMALLWVLYQVAISMFRTAKSSHKGWLAVTLLLSGFAWFIYTFISVYVQADENGTIATGLASSVAPEINNWLQKILPVASLIYLLLLAVPVSRFIRNYRYVQVIRRYGLNKIDAKWRIFVQQVASQMGIRKSVQIWVSEFVSSPVTVGFLKPVILMPMAALNNLSVQQMESVLLHELSHIRRHDYLINLLINFIQTILYFNPFVKAFVRVVEREREKNCDETVLQFQYSSYEYASALLTLEKNNQQDQAFVLAAAGHRNDLLQRIEAIVGVKKKKKFTLNKFAGVMAGLLCIIAINALVITNKRNKETNRPVTARQGSSSNRVFASKAEPGNPVSSPFISTEDERSHSNNNDQQPVAHAFSSAAEYFNSAPGFIQAGYAVPDEVPVLDEEQEEQVKAAIDASKKVIESVEWKTMEKNIADVLTQKEKELLKKEYRKEMNKVDWEQWETKLRMAYNNVDWNRVNEQLSKAVSNIRMDSLQKVYTTALSNLDETTRQLAEQDLKGIPDTDISLKDLAEKRRVVQKALTELKSTRAKKIVHL